ncbi:uncharacterized protein LOC129566979 [Sitodiplosis mosellana]|uniref:uncharacterized protein LOC129566979 n=1 Tax=Sitodiplosis mosellana TaxID=263140 RepID=UPI0024451F5D|nr:uncharacterized protein LOC129566979 [Sitodiplosis mosellana]
MEFKLFCCLVFVLVIRTKFVNSAKHYEHINDCYLYDAGMAFGNDNVTFICAEISRENIVFPQPLRFRCSNKNYANSLVFDWPGNINFKNCQFKLLKRNYFKDFPNMQTIDFSDVGLEVLQRDIFSEATNVTTLNVSRNNLKEIPSLIFVNAKKLSHVDISCNKIVQIDAVAFAGATKIESIDLSQNDLSSLDEQVFKGLSSLKMLNLSYNKFTELNSHNLSMLNLLKLDVSHNNLTRIGEHTFDELSELQLLDLSFNPIGDLKIDTFIHVLKLKHLNLRRTNISSIQIGTFSHQLHLVTLELSDNALKTLNFKLFYPIQHDLRTLYISGNQLSDLNGFRNALFPQLTSLDIKNNQFNCTYLTHFMESINWEKIHLQVDPHSINPQVSSIRGINCEVVAGQESSDDNSKLQHKSNDDILIKITLVLLCIIMLTFLVIFVTLNRKRIFDKSFCYWKNSTSNGQIATDRVEYCKEDRGNNKYGHDNVTFICAEINGENIVFPDPNNFNCSNFCRPVHFNWPGTINFENCRFNELKRNFFKDFQYVHTANLSDLGLEALQTDIFNQATKLTFLDVSKNNIKEIPSLIFMNAKTLTHVDFSCNKIVQIDAVAFSGATKIEHLDLSRNNLTHIKEHTFDKLSELKLLNLSFNSIGDLKIDTFIHLLKPTNTSSVQAGTLLHQSHLVTLDLSENALKTLDFTLHYPIQYELRTLNISKNQLSSLNGFRNSLFPQLTSLDIKNNRFNCTYLRHFMESINWEDIRLPIDSHSMNPQSSSNHSFVHKIHFRSSYIDMDLKTFYALVCLFVSLPIFAFCVEKYEHISDCHFYDRSVVTGIDNVTFICAKYDNENGVFIDQARFKCSNHHRNVYDYYPGTIDFRNCRFSKLGRNFFKQFPRMHTFVMTNLELKTLEAKIFSEAKNITTLIASNNQIAEIPAILFANAKRLISADFSNNSIERVDRLGFTGASSLETLDLSQNALTSLAADVFIDQTSLKVLNLSYNQINELEPQTLSTHNLLTLDLSNNELTNLKENTFYQIISLKSLNLSDNPIESLEIGTFNFVPNLEVLNLRRTNLSSIQFGTFSHQHKLISLDLSENLLKQLDFNLFMPIMHDLRSLELDGNQLTDLDGFGNALFPQLELLDIKNNNFNCSYLIQFMKTISWEKIRLPVDPTAVTQGQTHVRGIRCEIVNPNNIPDAEEIDEAANEAMTKDGNAQSNDYVFTNFFMIFMCVVMLTFLVVYLTLNIDQIRHHLRRSNHSRPLNGRLSSAALNFDYANEDSIH